MWVINHGRLTLYLPSKFKPILNMLRPWIFDFKPIWSEKTWFLLQSPPNDVIFKPNRKWYENATKNVAVSIKLSKLCRKPHVHIIFRSEEESVQTNFRKKKTNSINIYKWDKWDYTAAKNHDFSKILDVNLNMPVKDGKKILVMYLKGNFLRISKMASDFS